MKNKKVLSLLLAGVMITAIPFNVFADEPEKVKADKTAVVETVEEREEAKVETTESETLEISEEKVSEELKAPAPTGTEFKVTFNPDNGKNSTFVYVKEGERAPEQTAPTKDGFDFVEWQKPDGTKFEFTTPITAEITLKAAWKAKTPATEKFTVKFNSDGGSLVAEQTIERGKMATEPTAPTKDGYNFLGWYDGSDKFDFKTTPIIADKNLIAKWEADKPAVPVTKDLSISERYYDNGRFYGKVTADGVAVEDATVTLYDYDGDKTGKSTTTDENGYFDIYVGYDYRYYDDDYYYDDDGYRYYRDGDEWYYYDSNGKKHWTSYRPYRYNRSRRYKYYDGYLKAEKSGYNSDKYTLDYYDGYYRNYRYDRFDRYYRDDYDKRVYPTDISRTSYSTKGYLKGYRNTTVYVYDGNDYLGRDTTDSDGYFKVTWDSPSISTSRNLEYYVYGSKYSTNNEYSGAPTINAVSAGAKFVRGNADANASITVYDSNGNSLGSTTAGDTGIYNVSLSRALRAGETIKVESKETGSVAKTTNYTVGGVAVSTEKVNQPAYISGFPDGTFKPGKEVTRAEAVRMFVKLVNNGAELPKNPTTSFKDANNAWYSDEINYAVAKGFIKGYSDGTFKPNQAITRAEFAQMISAFVKNGYPGTGSFKDVKGHWASDAISALYGNKNIKGYSDGTFKPDQKLTRAEAVTILNSVFGRNTKSNSFANVSEAGLRRFSDVSKSHWAYYEILDASNGHNAAKIEGMDQVSIWQ